MATTLYMRRVMTRLVPEDRISEELLGELSANAVLRCEITQPRNLKHHRKYWALVHKLFPHQTAYATREDLHDALKIGVGLFRMIRDPRTGKDVPRADSIAFDKLDQKGFEEVYARIEELVCSRIVPHLRKADLRAEVMDMLDGRRPVENA